jgi:Mg-chelatase subunit ChlD
VAQKNKLRLTEGERILPALCSIKTIGGNRTNVDLICVIDVSGSMAGLKLNLVKSTL